MKVGLVNVSNSLCGVGSPNLGFLKEPTCLIYYHAIIGSTANNNGVGQTAQICAFVVRICY